MAFFIFDGKNIIFKPSRHNKLICFIIFILILGTSSLAQDTTKSQAFKNNRLADRYPLIKPKYPSYPLIAGFLLMKEARDGDPFAQHELGLRYILGNGFKTDTVLGVYWIKKAVDRNVTTAKFNYGIMLVNEIGVDWNPFEAYRNFKFAAEAGMPEAQFAYALFFLDNLVVNRNLSEAYKWTKRANKAGVEQAGELLKYLKENGFDSEEDSLDAENDTLDKPDSSFYYAGVSAVMSHDYELDYFDFSEDSLGKENDVEVISGILNKRAADLKEMLHITDFGGNENIIDTTGMGLIKFAASSGSPEALLLLGRTYENGIGVINNKVLAALYYIRAFRLGSNKAAQLLFTLIRENGFFDDLKILVDKNNSDAMFVWAGLVALGFDYQLTSEQAFDLLEKASLQNHIPSILEKGLCYYSGTLVNKDEKKAVEIWKKAVELGSSEAAVRIAFTNIIEGESKEKMSDDIKVLTQTSNNGSVLAQAALAYCYEKGIGVKKNKATAVKFYRFAAQRGNQTAYSSLVRMYNEIRPDDEEFKIVNEY